MDFTPDELSSLFEEVRSFAKYDNSGDFGPEDRIHSFIYSANVTEHLLCATTRLGTEVQRQVMALTICYRNSTISSL